MHAHPELEELSIGVVRPRGRSRPGARPILAAGGLVVLLAAGFGALGGRTPSSSPPAVALASGASGGPAIISPRAFASPRVTPASECGDLPVLPPRTLLFVDRRTYMGASTPEPLQERIEVPVDATSALVILGDACASAWTIDGGQFGIIDALYNPDLDPAYAAQNRFELFLYELRGQDIELTATFRFPGVESQSVWPIHVPDFVTPEATLDDYASLMAPDCDVTLALRNGFIKSRGQTGCPPGSIGFGGGTPQPVSISPGEELTFRLGDWDIDTGRVTCGHLVDGTFFESDPACRLPPGNFAGTIAFAGPSVLGRWTLAVEACAEEVRGADPPNTICGTWYAIVDVRA